MRRLCHIDCIGMVSPQCVSCMDSKLVLPQEFLITLIALEGFISSMCFYMPSKITLPREFLVTLIALVWVIFIATVKTVIQWEVIIRLSKKLIVTVLHNFPERCYSPCIITVAQN